MTRLPDIINQNINKYAPAMDALAKGEEMTICVHDWEFAEGAQHLFCVKCDKTIDGSDIINRLSMLEDDAARLRTEGDEYRAQLAERDALVERLVEAGEAVYRWNNYEDGKVWDALCAEYQAMKGGEG